MKEHRTKALRVTTPHSIESCSTSNKDEYIVHENANELFSTLEILQFDFVQQSNTDHPGCQQYGNKSRAIDSVDDVLQNNVTCLNSEQKFHVSGTRPRSSIVVATVATTIDSCTSCTTVTVTTALSTATAIPPPAICRHASHSLPNSAMTTHTANATANPVFGKHDSFYRWFSAEFEKDNEQPINQGIRDNQEIILRVDCVRCNNDGKDEQASNNCHCRSSPFCGRKFKHRDSDASPNNNIQLSSPSYQMENLCSVLDIVSGDLDKNWFLKLRDIKEVIRREKVTCSNSKDGGTRDGYNKWCQKKDSNGNTALLVSGRKLLEQKQFEKAFELAKILLEEGADVNVINNENRTLLSYSILHMDNSIRLTKLLINHGANVWPISQKPELPLRNSRIYEKYGSNSNCNSAFTWFLKGIMKQLKLGDHSLRTLYVLAEVMGEKPRSMHSHVMSTMFSHARCYSVLGPVFLQIKLAMSPYWSQPQSLKYLCRSVVRNSIISVPGRFINHENISSLMLPPSLQSYLMLEM